MVEECTVSATLFTISAWKIEKIFLTSLPDYDWLEIPLRNLKKSNWKKANDHDKEIGVI